MKRFFGLLGVCVVALAGCGGASKSDEEQIRERLDEFAAAVEAGDPVAACDQLSPAVKESLPKRYGECPEVIGHVLVDANQDEADALRNDVREISIEGDTATVVVPGGNYPMERVDGEWYVAE